MANEVFQPLRVMYKEILENIEGVSVSGEDIEIIEKSLVNKEQVDLLNFKSIKFMFFNFIS